MTCNNLYMLKSDLNWIYCTPAMAENSISGLIMLEAWWLRFLGNVELITNNIVSKGNFSKYELQLPLDICWLVAYTQLISYLYALSTFCTIIHGLSHHQQWYTFGLSAKIQQQFCLIIVYTCWLVFCLKYTLPDT